MMFNRAASGVLLFLCAAYAPAAQAQEADCFGFDSLGPETTLSLAVIRDGTRRAHFVKNGSSQKSCPSAAPACRETAYLVPGDQVIVSAASPDFLCASYVGRKGLVRAGWLPRAVLDAVPLQASRLEDWIGRWTGGPEQTIRITKAGKPSELAIAGDASFGAMDPARVKRGAVNVGSISATARPDGSALAFTMGEADETLAYEAGDDLACRARMRLVGPYLLVADNGQCGGLNVSFSGAYRKIP